MTDTLIASFDAASWAPGHRIDLDPTIAAIDLSTDGSRDRRRDR